MKRILASFAVLALLWGCGANQTATSTDTASAPVIANGIEIRNYWATPTPGGVTLSAGYLTIVNHAAAGDTFLGANSPRANSVDVHTMRMENGVMEMRPAGMLAIPPGGALTMAPNGLHIMFTNVTAPFTEGETIPVTLHFDHGGDIEVSMPVRRTPP